jgi:hypothetical protein
MIAQLRVQVINMYRMYIYVCVCVDVGMCVDVCIVLVSPCGTCTLEHDELRHMHTDTLNTHTHSTHTHIYNIYTGGVPTHLGVACVGAAAGAVGEGETAGEGACLVCFALLCWGGVMGVGGVVGI